MIRQSASMRLSWFALMAVIAGGERARAIEVWDLEPGLQQAHLVMVARVSSISRVSVVEGAKTDVSLREFRFQPVRKLRGLFQRDELSMTASDLGFQSDEATGAPPLREGEFRLLILVQQRGMQSYGCVSAPPGANGFDERVPLLSGPDDPLVATVETLLAVAESRSRRERAELVLDRLAGAVVREAFLPIFVSPDVPSQEQARLALNRRADADGRAAVPLLASLAKRGDWAAADDRGYPTATRFARDASPSVRAAALGALQSMLASGTPPADAETRTAAGEALHAALQAEGGATTVRQAALDALGDLLALTNDTDGARELLIGQVARARTNAERAAAAAALASVDHADARAAVLTALEALPLDEVPERALAYAEAAVRADRDGAERVLLARLERALEAGQELRPSIVPLAKMRSAASVPLMLEAASRPTAGRNDHFYLAWAFGRLGDDRAAPVLADWLRPHSVAEATLTALETLDSPAAAREARPLIKSTSHLPYKLRLARLVARQGMADGYAMATEHLADYDHFAAAVLVLAALDDPRTASDLRAIIDARPSRRWHAAALAGLAATGDDDARRELREILADDRNPMIVDASEAAGLVGDHQLLEPLARLAASRNRPLAKAALVGLRRALSGIQTSPLGLADAERTAAELARSERNDEGLLPGAAEVPAAVRETVAEAAAAIAADTFVDAELRTDAFAVARLASGARYAELLEKLADQAELEDDAQLRNRGLLAEVQTERRRQELQER